MAKHLVKDGLMKKTWPWISSHPLCQTKFSITLRCTPPPWTLGKKESQVKLKKTAFSQEKSTKSQYFWLFVDFLLTLCWLDWKLFFWLYLTFFFTEYHISPTVKLSVSETHPHKVISPEPDIIVGIVAYWVSFIHLPLSALMNWYPYRWSIASVTLTKMIGFVTSRWSQGESSRVVYFHFPFPCTLGISM